MSEENKNLNESNTPEPKNDVVETNTKAESSATDTAMDEKSAKKAKMQTKQGKKGGFKNLLKSRKARHGSMAIAIVAVVIALVIVLNVVLGLLTERFPEMAIDLTANNSFALQEDTLDYVSHLDKDVTLNVLVKESVFESQGSYFVQAQRLLEKMESNSNGKLKLKYVDLTSNPTFTSNYPNVDWSGSTNNVILVECGDQYRALTLDDCFEYDSEVYSSYGQYQFTGTKIEQSVITAILNVTTEDKIVVDMITGNQEQDYSAITSLLENNAYSVNEVSLATQDIDDDAMFTILYAPSVDLDEGAVTKLSQWLDNDGKYGKSLIYVPSADKVDTPNLDAFLTEWGMQVNDGYVFETSNERLISSSSSYAFVVDYTDYYVEGLKNNTIPVVVTDAHDIIISDSTMAHSLLTTSTSAGVQPYDADENWDYNDAISGEELNIAAEGVKTATDETSSRVVVFGSYTMFSSTIMQYNSFNNSGYLMNVINTIANRDDIGITIESKSMDSSELGVTDVTTQNMLLIIFVIVLPLGILVTGLVMWLRRRNR